MIRVEDWDATNGPMTETVLRQGYLGEDRIRVSKHVYPAGVLVSGSMLAGRCFVLKGSCCYTFSKEEPLTLRNGQYADFPQGPYSVQAVDGADAEVLMVWRW